MPKPKNKNDNNNEIKIKVGQSSLAEFTKRPLPSEEEVEKFDKLVKEEATDGEIEESLNEIYQDKKGEIVNVKKLDIKKKRGFLFWFFTVIFLLGGTGGAGYAAHYYFYEQPGSDATAVDFLIEGKNEVAAGEEFFWTVHYKNLSNININNARIALTYPDNFIFMDSSPVSTDKNNVWLFNSVTAQTSGKIKIKGKMVGHEDKTGIVLANLTYTPENFSSEFKKETSLAAVIKDIGLDFDFDYISSVLVGDENEIKIKYSGKENNFINNFRLTIEPQENVDLTPQPPLLIRRGGDTVGVGGEVGEGSAGAEYLRPGVWQINKVTNEEQELLIKLKFTEKVADDQDIVLNFEQLGENNEYYKFYEKKLNFEVMKSDLNLTLIINGSREDQGINFGQTLNYSIVYKNKGETEMKDVIIMAVLESDFLDWTGLSDSLNGRERGNTISWSKEELSELEVLEQDEEGTIDFFIQVMDIGEINTDKDYQVKSFAQFSVGNLEEVKEDSDTRSNTIINKINSDLKLKEQVRYFNDDNIPVGTGPHPPKTGEQTSYKIYWDLSNNLHELKDLKIMVKLPDYVKWNNKNQTTVGTVKFNSETGEVIWDIGRLPITVYRANAEFSIMITPSEKDKNTIMVLLPGTEVQAIDIETEDAISATAKAKTTKLEDDEIAAGDGIVE